MKLLNVLILSLLVSFCGNAQVSTTSLGNGNYKYDSEFPDEDLHFYIFDDGYHTFNNSPTHQFPIYANPASVKFYHSEPYSDDEPIDIDLNIVNDGISNPSVPSYTFDNMVSISTSWNLVENQNDFYILKFENTQSETPISGCLEFHYDDLKVKILPNEILDEYGNDWVEYIEVTDSDYQGYRKKFVWEFENLENGEQRFVYLPTKCLAPSMTNVRTRAVLKLENECDVTLPWIGREDGSKPNVQSSQIYTLRSVVQNNPHDPNCIVSNPKCLPREEEGIVTIDYKVYFQNEGEDPATYVGLEYLIDAPILNVNLVAASHTCFMDLSTFANLNLTTTEILFDFNYIYLRGLREEKPPLYEETVGWVEFQICYSMEHFAALNLECAESVVHITFNNEAPVTAYNTICKEDKCAPSSLGQLDAPGFNCLETINLVQYYSQDSHEEIPGNPGQYINNNLEEIGIFEVSPNPSFDFINVSGQIDEGSEINIFNTVGKLMTKVTPLGKINKIDISTYNQGMYFISILSNGEVKTKPFVKY